MQTNLAGISFNQKLKQHYAIGKKLGEVPPYGEVRIGQHKKSGA